MYPLFSLRSLPTNIKHSVRVGTKVENRFNDASGFETRTEDILVSWNVIFGEETVKVFKVAAQQFN